MQYSFVICGCFGNMCTCTHCVLYFFLYCIFVLFRLVYLFLFVLSVLVKGLLPPSENSIAVIIIIIIIIISRCGKSDFRTAVEEMDILTIAVPNSNITRFKRIILQFKADRTLY